MGLRPIERDLLPAQPPALGGLLPSLIPAADDPALDLSGPEPVRDWAERSAPSLNTPPLLPPRSAPERVGAPVLLARGGGDGDPLPVPVRPAIGAAAAKDGEGAARARSLPTIRYDSADPGDFYCEHVYFVAQERALAASGSVVRDGQGDPLVGFIHLPEDAATTQAPTASPSASALAARHGDTRRVVGAAIAGDFHEAAGRTTGPVNLLITGFGPFQSFTNNPSGDFVQHRANIDAAMREAFGANLVGVPPASADMNQPLSYQVRQDDGTVREVRVRALCLPVDDTALDPARADSIPGVMASFRPHAVISLGLRPGAREYWVEGRADDGGLARGPGGGYRHDGAQSRSSEGRRNGSLERAIEWARTHPAR